MMGHMAEQAFEPENAPHFAFKATSTATKTEKRQITRNRTSYSCQTCRRRKIKCDKQHPKCGTCLNTNEACVYGSMESAAPDVQANGHERTVSGAKRRLSPVASGLPSPPIPRCSQEASVEPPNLGSVELQLQRLTSMLATLRRESSLVVRPHDPLTPVSGEGGSHNGRASSRSTDGEVVGDAQPGLTRPLSELNITGIHKAIPHTDMLGFWPTIVEEIEQLHAMMQGIHPLGPLPHADLGMAACPNRAYRAGDQNNAVKLRPHNDSVSFRDIATTDVPGSSNSDCRVCFQNACDKSMLLPGCNSARLVASTRLDLTAGIPTEAQSNVLVRAWLTSVYPVLPFMSIRHVFKKHQAFWDWRRSVELDPDQSKESADVYFMPVLYTVWYSGTLGLSSKGFKTWFPGKSRAQMAAHYHEQVIRYLSLVSFPSHLQAPLIGCFVLLQSIPAAEEEPVQSSTFINLMVKLAQRIGIHREPTLFGVPPHEAEMRRRLWWQILRLDVTFASSNGYSPFVGDEMADTRTISEVHESFIGTPEEKQVRQASNSDSCKRTVLPEPLRGSPSTISVFQLVAKTTHTVALALRKAVNMHTSTKLVNKEALQAVNSTINSAEEEVRDTIRRIPAKGVPELGFTPDANSFSNWPLLECDPCFGESLVEAEYSYYFGSSTCPVMPATLSQYHYQKLSAFNKWARICLSTMCDQMYCVTYAPFLKSSRSKVWTTGRQCALHHCSSFLRKFISLVTDPGLESFRWHWPGTLNPMHAAMIVLVDVYERPHSVEAPRCRALIDKIFSLSDPVNGITGGSDGVSTQRPLREGGSDAWDLLRDLRSSGWRKAGLDPNVLWTEEDQIMVGVAMPLTPEQRMMRGLREDLLEPEDEVGAFPQPQAAGWSPGLRYALGVVKQGFEDADDPAQVEWGQDDVNTPMTASERPLRQLLKLSTQQLMPYPLYGYERAQCLVLDDHIDQEVAEAETMRIRNVLSRAEALPEEIVGSAIFAPPPPKQKPTSTSSHQRLQIPGYFNVDASMRAATKGSNAGNHATRAGGNSSSKQTSLQDRTTETSDMPNGDAQMDDLAENFDWERWDAVFGQYSGFTDLMEMDTDNWVDPSGHH